MLNQIELNETLEFVSIDSSDKALCSVLRSSGELATQAVCERKAKIRDIKDRIAKGTYFVSSNEIAKAIVEWDEK